MISRSGFLQVYMLVIGEGGKENLVAMVGIAVKTFRSCLVRQTRMEWNLDLNSEELGVKLEF